MLVPHSGAGRRRSSGLDRRLGMLDTQCLCDSENRQKPVQILRQQLLPTESRHTYKSCDTLKNIHYFPFDRKTMFTCFLSSALGTLINTCYFWIIKGEQQTAKLRGLTGNSEQDRDWRWGRDGERSLKTSTDCSWPSHGTALNTNMILWGMSLHRLRNIVENQRQWHILSASTNTGEDSTTHSTRQILATPNWTSPTGPKLVWDHQTSLGHLRH